MGTGHYQMGRVVWGPRARAPARQSFLPEGRPGRDGHHHPLDDIGPDSFALLSVLSGARPTRPINFVLVQGWRNRACRGCAIDMFFLHVLGPISAGSSKEQDSYHRVIRTASCQLVASCMIAIRDHLSAQRKKGKK